ncbi:MAG: ribonuclease P protein component [Rhodospirillales bacterium]|nr:ribonuclease P protein component [Rhodospirillales bacterium]
MQLPGEFARVRNTGQRLACGCLILNWAPAHSTATRLGVVTSRKLGNAVKRSRARRLMRECFRRHQGELRQPVHLVLVARNSISGRDFAAVEVDYLKALQRAGLLEASA